MRKDLIATPVLAYLGIIGLVYGFLLMLAALEYVHPPLLLSIASILFISTGIFFFAALTTILINLRTQTKMATSGAAFCLLAISYILFQLSNTGNFFKTLNPAQLKDLEYLLFGDLTLKLLILVTAILSLATIIPDLIRNLKTKADETKEPVIIEEHPATVKTQPSKYKKIALAALLIVIIVGSLAALGAFKPRPKIIDTERENIGTVAVWIKNDSPFPGDVKITLKFYNNLPINTKSVSIKHEYVHLKAFELKKVEIAIPSDAIAFGKQFEVFAEAI